jgi:hypothetical protein
MSGRKKTSDVLGRLKFFGGRAARQLADAWRDARLVAAQNQVSTLHVLRDLIVLNATRSLGIRPYFQYRLFDPALTAADKRHYLPDTPWANVRLWARFNPKQYRCLYANKLIFNRFFAAAGLPVATVFGVYDPLVGRALDGTPLRSSADLRRWLPGVAKDGFVFKPIEGVRGHSILVFEGPAGHDPNAFATLAGELYDAEGLVAFAQDTARLARHRPGANRRPFLIEQRIRPHPKLAEFIGPTLCTVRVQTIIGVSGEAKVVAAVFKLQSSTAGVDHLIYGAVGCWVDPESGTLGVGRTRDSLLDVTTIPGTRTSFVGFQLPDWDSTKELALQAAGAFPWARSIGWDVAISDSGPVLIEGNEEWSPSLIQMPAPHGLMRGEFAELYHRLGTDEERFTSPGLESGTRSPRAAADFE